MEPIEVALVASVVTNILLFGILSYLLFSKRIRPVMRKVEDLPIYKRTNMQEVMVDPSAPTSRASRPKGKARVTTAHFSQRRSNW